MARADKMIQDLLDASQVKAGHRLPIQAGNCNLVELCQEVVEEFTIIHGDRFALKTPDELTGHIDCDGFRRILENLLSNAIKYGHGASKVFIELDGVEKKILLQVTNYGNPISPEDLPTLFDPYKRVDTVRHIKGWGIGLSLVNGFTEAHGGEVSVTSSQEEGTRFTVRLPQDVRSN